MKSSRILNQTQPYNVALKGKLSTVWGEIKNKILTGTFYTDAAPAGLRSGGIDFLMKINFLKFGNFIKYPMRFPQRLCLRTGAVPNRTIGVNLGIFSSLFEFPKRL